MHVFVIGLSTVTLWAGLSVEVRAGSQTVRHELAVGARFFDWARKMTVDAFYTSAIGIKDLGYLGNKALSKYEVPKEALEYAIKRSPFANG